MNDLKKNIDQSLELKKEMLEQSKAFYQQALFCSTTVFSVLIALNNDAYQAKSLMFVIRSVSLCLLLLNIISLILALYAPLRVVSKTHEIYSKKLVEKVRNPNVNMTVFVNYNFFEKVAMKMAIPLIILSMISLLIFGIMNSIKDIPNPILF